MKRIIVAALVAAASPAFAGAPHHYEMPKPTLTANQSQGQEQGQAQGQQQDQGQDQSQTQTAEGGAGGAGGAGGEGGNAEASNSGVQSQSNVAVHTEVKRSASSATSASSNNTADCYYSEGIGLQGLLAGVSFHKARRDRDCRRFALAQYLYGVGNSAAADRVMCEITELKTALGGDCLALVHQLPGKTEATLVPTVAPAAPPAAVYVECAGSADPKRIAQDVPKRAPKPKPKEGMCTP